MPHWHQSEEMCKTCSISDELPPGNERPLPFIIPFDSHNLVAMPNSVLYCLPLLKGRCHRVFDLRKQILPGPYPAVKAIKIFYNFQRYLLLRDAAPVMDPPHWRCVELTTFPIADTRSHHFDSLKVV
jgi:hypothetical protein